MPKNDCPVCQQEGPHYVPQGCIRSLLAKVVALSERVGALEGPGYTVGDQIPDAALLMPAPHYTVTAVDGDGPVVTIGIRPTQSERMKQYWRNKKAQGA